MNKLSDTIRIQLIESITISEAGLHCLLEREPDFELLEHFQCGPACNCTCAQNKHNFDILLMVMNFGEQCSLECTRNIIKRNPELSIFVLCMIDDPYLARRLLDLGIKGLICSHTPPEILFRAIREVARGGTYIDTNIARVIATMNSDNENPFATLTLREYEISRLMLSGLSHKEIGKQLFISPKTVANHHAKILKKLGVSNHIALTKLAIRHKITTF